MSPIDIVIIILAASIVVGTAVGAYIRKKKGKGGCGCGCVGCPHSSVCASKKEEKKPKKEN